MAALGFYHWGYESPAAFFTPNSGLAQLFYFVKKTSRHVLHDVHAQYGTFVGPRFARTGTRDHDRAHQCRNNVKNSFSSDGCAALISSISIPCPTKSRTNSGIVPFGVTKNVSPLDSPPCRSTTSPLVPSNSASFSLDTTTCTVEAHLRMCVRILEFVVDTGPTSGG